MSEINVITKLKDIPREDFKTSIHKLLFNLSKDTGMKFENSIYTCDRVCHFLYDCNKWPGLNWGNIIKVFDDISSGFRECKRLSVQGICGCINEFHKEWKDIKRYELQAFEEQIDKDLDLAGQNIYAHLSSSEMAAALRWKIQNLDIENWHTFSLAEIVDKGFHKEIKNLYTRVNKQY